MFELFWKKIYYTTLLFIKLFEWLSAFKFDRTISILIEIHV